MMVQLYFPLHVIGLHCMPCPDVLLSHYWHEQTENEPMYLDCQLLLLLHVGFACVMGTDGTGV